MPSERENTSGNSFNQVSSPYMSSFPWGFEPSCPGQVSWLANVDVVSDSAKLSMTSKKEGMDPVVNALILGIVMVGDAAWAVNGMAAPSLIRLSGANELLSSFTTVAILTSAQNRRKNRSSTQNHCAKLSSHSA